MATKRAAPKATAKSATVKVAANSKPVALTLKVDQQTYIRLCTLGATQRRTNQDILTEALEQYLRRSGT